MTTFTSAAGVKDDARALLREHLKNPAFALDGKAEYLITDPAFIEPVLDQALKYIDTTKPLSPQKLADAKRSAVTYYSLYQKQPAGLKALEAVIAKRFAQPVVTRHASPTNPAGEVIELDFGWFTGPLTGNSRSGIEHYVATDNPEGRGPSSQVLAGLLTDAARAYPRAERVTLIITFPRSRLGRATGRDMHITYIRSGFPPSLNGWVQVTSKISSLRPLYQVWAKNGDFAPYRDGRYSFYENCMPIPGVGRVPRNAEPTYAQRRLCLNYAEPSGD